MRKLPRLAPQQTNCNGTQLLEASSTLLPFGQTLTCHLAPGQRPCVLSLGPQDGL